MALRKVTDVARRARLAWAPQARMTVSQWAEAYRVLPPEAAASPGRWRNRNSPHMCGPMDAYNDPTCEVIACMFSSQMAKALALDTPIPTPTGWTTMAELAPGAEVFAGDGTPTKVVGVSEVFEGHTCYRVAFSDGAEIVADAGHKWKVDIRNAGSAVMTTQELVDAGVKRGKANVFAVHVTPALDLPEAPLPIDPYLLGLWLGDGHSYSSNITMMREDWLEVSGRVSEPWKVVEETPTGVWTVGVDRRDRTERCVRGHEYARVGKTKLGHCAECAREAALAHKWKRPRPSMRTHPSLGERLGDLGVLKNKHVPPAYLRASREQRLELLRGLMDTDGTVDKRTRRASITLSDPTLFAGVLELVRSLGYKPSLREWQPPKGRLARSMSFMAYDDVPIFHLGRKRAIQPPREGRRTTETFRRRITAIEPVASVPTKCITVAAGCHTFLAGKEMVPTHNSEGLVNAMLYAIDRRPAPMLLIQPTTGMAKSFVKDRVDPSIRDTPAIKAKVAPAKKGESTITHKKFPGGHLTAIGANSSAELASRPIRDIFGDEIDRWPLSVGKEGKVEGDPLDLAMKRTTTFHDKKVFIVSTPTVAGISRIEKLWESGTQESYQIPCPHCGALQALQWENLRFEFDAPEKAHYICAHCGEKINEAQKRAGLLVGVWVAAHPGRIVRSFHINELSSPWRTFAQIATDYVGAYKRGRHSLRVFWNTVLGLPWEDSAALRMDEEALRKREYEFDGKIPADAAFLTVAVDVQKDRLEVMFVAHSPYRERWVIPVMGAGGDPQSPYQIWGSYQDKKTWDALDRVVFATFTHASGKRMRASAVFVDSSDGNSVEHVHKYVKPRHANRVFAIKGSGAVGAPPLGTVKEYGNLRAKTFPLGVDAIKTGLHDTLTTTEIRGPGYIHFPKGLPPAFYEQLTAEKAVIRTVAGSQRRVWEPVKQGARNEAWDLLVYNDAAALLIRFEDAVKLLESLNQAS